MPLYDKLRGTPQKQAPVPEPGHPRALTLEEESAAAAERHPNMRRINARPRESSVGRRSGDSVSRRSGEPQQPGSARSRRNSVTDAAAGSPRGSSGITRGSDPGRDVMPRRGSAASAVSARPGTAPAPVWPPPFLQPFCWWEKCAHQTRLDSAEERAEDLERLVGKLTMENRKLRKQVGIPWGSSATCTQEGLLLGSGQVSAQLMH